MNENLTINEPYFDLEALAKCKFPTAENVKMPVGCIPIQMPTMICGSEITAVKETVKTVHNFGKRLAGDVSGANCLCLYEGDNKWQKRTEFLSPSLAKAERIKVHTKDGVEIAYRLFKQNFFVSAEDNDFFMYLADMDKWSNINRVLAMNGIAVTYTGRDAGQLFETYVNGITVSESEYPYKQGWNDGKFMYNENGKKLVTNDNLSHKKSFDAILEQLKAVKNKSVRLFIFLLMHLVLLGEVMDIEEIKKTVFGLYGNIKTGNQLGKLFFQFFNRDNDEICFLYDKDIIEHVERCKDEVFVIIDNFPETKYKQVCAENNLSDVKDTVFKGRCEGICLFVSDCGVVADDEKIFHLTAHQKELKEVEFIKEAVGTHIKYFTEWLERNAEDLKDSLKQSQKEIPKGRKQLFYSL